MRSSHLVLLALTAGCIEYDLPPEPGDNSVWPPEVPVPNIEVTPDEVPFGTWTTECPTEPRTVTVRNVGTDGSTLELTSIAVAEGLETFGLQDGETTAQLGTADVFEFGVWFQPTSSDPSEGLVRIASNDPDEPTVDVQLTGEGAGEPPFEVMDRFEQAIANEVDVLFVVDNSGSMGDEQDELGNSFSAFMDSFQAMDIDFHLAVTSTAMTADGYDAPLAGKFAGAPTILDSSMDDATVVAEFAELAALGTNGTGNETGLDAAHAALTAPLVTGYNAGFLRPAANLAIVIVSDEPDASAIQPGDFADWLDAMKPDPSMSTLSAITGLEEPTSIFNPIQWCDPNNKLSGNSTEYGVEYIEAADATGGIALDLCEDDWSGLATFLAYTAAGLASEFPLSEVPNSVGSITVLVDGAPVAYSATSGWTYDAEENAVVFHGSAMPGPDEDVVVTYEVDVDAICD